MPDKTEAKSNISTFGFSETIMKLFNQFHRRHIPKTCCDHQLSSKICCSIILIASAGFAMDVEPQWAGMLKKSDVLFMYEASSEVYADYEATILAWGGTPTPQALEDAKGVLFFGSVGMVTEFAQYYERFPKPMNKACAVTSRAILLKYPGSATSSTKEFSSGGAAPISRNFDSISGNGSWKPCKKGQRGCT